MMTSEHVCYHCHKSYITDNSWIYSLDDETVAWFCSERCRNRWIDDAVRQSLGRVFPTGGSLLRIRVRDRVRWKFAGKRKVMQGVVQSISPFGPTLDVLADNGEKYAVLAGEILPPEEPRQRKGRKGKV